MQKYVQTLGELHRETFFVIVKSKKKQEWNHRLHPFDHDAFALPMAPLDLQVHLHDSERPKSVECDIQHDPGIWKLKTK
jgi:hypothetical protein